ncbi:hypothetical protein AMTRI_Chr03g138750 [Amborella trichopoda]|uniref:RRM domain-containing protein n=1 Tax=Amborella trichopoda TaxID=13333 RepID=W1PUV7_AMBTC|nr:UBP1-associated protein 2C [Amborella trichopoda]ERN11609.1 hypothetical protein AMTR_s00022p00189710 [Amborella trichopoda]|eukprot:XP_006850028.1 UBP1-associated protein 2C [Amborella trichopoda]
MDEAKKRRLEETGSGEEEASGYEGADEGAVEQLRSLLDPLKKEQLLDLLIKLGSQNPQIAAEIRDAACSDPVHRKLFVRGLAWDTTSETLCDAFLVYGEIEEGAVIMDKAAGKSRGFGFVTYKDMESAQRALKEPSKLIDGRLTVCNLACEGLTSASASTDQAQRKLYIGGLSTDISSKTLLSWFSKYGEIEEGSVAYDKDTNNSRGFGFITFKTVEAAKKAIDDPAKVLEGRAITVKLADTQKNKGPTQLPAAVIPVAFSLPPGYPPVNIAGKPAINSSTPPLGYSGYPAGFPAYPSYPSAAPQYPQPVNASYGPVAGKPPQVGMTTGANAGVGAYPYYAMKK